MNQLELFLNTRITRGRKSFDLEYITNIVHEDKRIVCRQNGKHWFSYSLRELVSLESGLWQTLEESKLLPTLPKKENSYWRMSTERSDCIALDGKADYRILRSALVPEEELAQFLLDNIILQGNSK